MVGLIFFFFKYKHLKLYISAKYSLPVFHFLFLNHRSVYSVFHYDLSSMFLGIFLWSFRDVSRNFLLLEVSLL